MRLYSGIDIVSNHRIAKAYDRFGDRFLNRVYLPSEIDYCKSKREFINCLAARFAGKEAVIKAFYKAFGRTLHFKDIEIVGKNGGPAETLLHIRYLDLNNCQIDISISHEKDFSIAYSLIFLP